MFRLAPLRTSPLTPLLTQTFLHPRTISTTPRPLSAITDAIKRDHRDLESLYNNIMCSNPTSDPDTAARWQNQFVWTLARHSIAEELVVYPAFEKHIPSGAGKAMADKDRGGHQNVGVASPTWCGWGADKGGVGERAAV